MANEKLFKLTKNEAYFLKKILPSCKLTAYQIPLFQSVMNALDKPIKISDEIYKMAQVYPTYPTDDMIYSEPIQNPLTPAPPVVHPHFTNIPKVSSVTTKESEEKLNKIAQHFQSPGVTKSILQDRSMEKVFPDTEQPTTSTPVVAPEIESSVEPEASMFDVIDSRSK